METISANYFCQTYNKFIVESCYWLFAINKQKYKTILINMHVVRKTLDRSIYSDFNF